MFWISSSETESTSVSPTSESEMASNSVQRSNMILSLFARFFSSSSSNSAQAETVAHVNGKSKKLPPYIRSNCKVRNNHNHLHKRRNKSHKNQDGNRELKNAKRTDYNAPIEDIPLNKNHLFASIAILVFLSIAVYLNTIEGEFIHDDVVSIVRNKDVIGPNGWWTMWWNDYWGADMASVYSHKSYRPLTIATFRLNYIMSGALSEVAFHWTNILMHTACCLLMLKMCLQILRMTLASSFAACAIFAVHPVHTETVSGITGRSDGLACLLMLISFLLYSKSIVSLHSKNGRESEKESSTDSSGHSCHSSNKSTSSTTKTTVSASNNRKTKTTTLTLPLSQRLFAIQNHGLTREIIGSAILGGAAMLAKETGITVLAINMGYDFYIHAHIIRWWWNATKIQDQSQNVIRFKRRFTFMTTMILVSLAGRLAVMNGTFPRFSQQDNPAAYCRSDLTRFLTYAFLPAFNAWLMICPYRLSYDWQMGSIPLVETIWDVRNVYSLIFYLVFAAITLRALIAKYRRSRTEEGTKIFTSLLFIGAPFLPASNLFFPVGFVAAERILYTPSIGFCILIAHGMDCIKNRLPAARKFLVLALCLMLMSLSFKTWNQNLVWQSRESLFESGVRENPMNAKVHYNYANLQKDLGDIQTAVKHYKIAIRLWPTYASAYNNLGALSSNMADAEACFLKAIQANPQHNGAHFNLGVIYMRSEKYAEALLHLEECLKIDPSHVEALQYLGACYNVLNKTHEVENVFHKLISSDLPPSKLHTNFGVFLEELVGYGSYMEKLAQIAKWSLDALPRNGNLNPGDPSYYMKQSGLNSKGLTQFLIALTRASWDTSALGHAAHLAHQLGAEGLFHELSERLLSFKFDPAVAYMVAVSFMEKGKVSEAKVIFERLSEESDSFYKINYAQMLMQVRRWSDAEWVVKGIHYSDPNHPLSLLLLAQIYENMNKTQEAYELLTCAVENFCPQEINLCARFYSQLGNLMHTTGNFNLAADYYEMAIKFNPSSLQAHTNIGAIYHLMNNYKLAEAHYHAALVIEPNNQVVLSNIQKLERTSKSSNSNVPTSQTDDQNDGDEKGEDEPQYDDNHNLLLQSAPHLGGPLHNTNKFQFSWQ